MNGGNTQATIDLQLKDWPLIPSLVLSDDIVQSLGPCFFFCSVMVIFISILNSVVSEKEAKLRHGMEMMGLKPCIYWISQYLSYTVLVFFNSLLTVVFGIAFGFTAFKNTSFFVSILQYIFKFMEIRCMHVGDLDNIFLVWRVDGYACFFLHCIR